MPTRRHVLAAGAGLALMPRIGLSRASAAGPQELILGYSMAKTGPYVSLAAANEVAVDFAVEEINAKGGINGKRLKVVKFDTGGEPRQAQLAVRQLAEDGKALAIIGPFSSSEVRIAFPAGERAGIAQMSMASSAPNLAKGFSFAFRNTTDEAQVIDQVLAAIKAKGLPSASAAIAYASDDTVSKSVGVSVLPTLFPKHGVPILGSVDFQLAAFDLSPQVSKIAQMKPDIVGLGAPPEGAINLAKELRRQGVATRVIGGTTIADPDLPARMDGAGETMTIGTTFFHDVDARTRAFTAEFGKRARAAGLSRIEPNQFDASVYDIVYLYAEAMKVADLTGDPARAAEERIKLRDALRALRNYPALEGPISFNADGDAIKPVYIIEVRQGKWALLDKRTAS